jgi:hypothetical protein
MCSARLPDPDLSFQERAAIATRRDFVIEKMPEAAAMIKELYALGMIDGWRAVVKAGPLTDDERQAVTSSSGQRDSPHDFPKGSRFVAQPK